MNIYAIGSGVTKFGELWGTSPRILAKKAFAEALDDAGIPKGRVEALFVGNMLSGILGGQEHLGALFAQELGLNAPAFKIEGACASGGLALHNAVNSVLSNQYQTVAVLGVEKMTDHKPEDVATALMGAGTDVERMSGATFPGLYAILARAHMAEYRTTEEELAGVSVKNHFHASLNPKAQFTLRVTVEQVMKSTLIADPLKLLDCSPISDGAAAVIITSRKPAKKSPKVVASAVATDTLGLAERESLTELAATKKAAKKAFTLAGVSPSDIDIAEVHDCFSIAETLALEDIGFYPKGRAAGAVARGEVTLGSKGLVVNTSGGLKACGHPVGATGVKQVAELIKQLTGKSGRRQVKGAKLGLAQNVGGSGATAVIHILKI
ncbi:MAG TPA: thiolase domain-containing protein [Patescibacteria group bacterium]|nr:thiolase domain-containing protein [Patescibacteria group bacterium]